MKKHHCQLASIMANLPLTFTSQMPENGNILKYNSVTTSEFNNEVLAEWNSHSVSEHNLDR